MPSRKNFSAFRRKIWSHYEKHRRSFPWRENPTQYNVLISEIMLQQTQTERVVPRFEQFVEKYPDWHSLAGALRGDILREWQGLGYNRRTLYLKEIAEEVVKVDYRTGMTRWFDNIPKTYDDLIKLPGIGPNTAGSILAFAWNTPHPFIETNIRSVFIYHFFKGRGKISDKKILSLVEQSIDKKRPRDWFYALMDYGVYLKQNHRTLKAPDPARKSKHYKKQSSFKGSNRELRAALLKSILKRRKSSAALLSEFITKNHTYRTRQNILKNLKTLTKEGFISIKKGAYQIKEK